jgi:hypothetical protein
MYVLFFTNNRALLVNSIRKERCLKINSIIVLISYTIETVFTRYNIQYRCEVFCFENAAEFRWKYGVEVCTILFVSLNETPRIVHFYLLKTSQAKSWADSDKLVPKSWCLTNRKISAKIEERIFIYIYWESVGLHFRVFNRYNHRLSMEVDL